MASGDNAGVPRAPECHRIEAALIANSSVSTPTRRLRHAGRNRRRAGARRDLDGLVEVGDDVVDVLDADRDANQLRSHAAGDLIGRRQLLVSGGCGVDDQTLRVADVGQQAEELDRVDELAAGVDATLEPEGHDATEATAEVLLGVLVSWVRGEAGVADPRDGRSEERRVGK